MFAPVSGGCKSPICYWRPENKTDPETARGPLGPAPQGTRTPYLPCRDLPLLLATLTSRTTPVAAHRGPELCYQQSRRILPAQKPVFISVLQGSAGRDRPGAGGQEKLCSSLPRCPGGPGAEAALQAGLPQSHRGGKPDKAGVKPPSPPPTLLLSLSRGGSQRGSLGLSPTQRRAQAAGPTQKSHLLWGRVGQGPSAAHSAGRGLFTPTILGTRHGN